MDRTTLRYNRRRFLRGSLALAGVGLLAGCGMEAPQATPTRAVRRIGYLTGDWPGGRPVDEALEEGLRELGHAVGRDLLIEYRFAEGRQDRLPELAEGLVRSGAELIVTVGGVPAAQAAQRATGTLPIVLVSGYDPVEAGLVASLARPGGNVTGVTLITTELGAKRLELLREVVPGLRRAAVLWNSGNPVYRRSFDAVRDAAQTLGVEVQSLGVQAAEQLEDAIEAAARDRADAVVVLPDPITVSHQARIADLTARSRLPAIHPFREFAAAGGLMAYGANRLDAIRRAASYVDRIFKGASPADLPVELPAKFDFAVNLTTAQALGLIIPPAVLQQATEIIQ